MNTFYNTQYLEIWTIHPFKTLEKNKTILLLVVPEAFISYENRKYGNKYRNEKSESMKTWGITGIYTEYTIKYWFDSATTI
jgi:hypothetical protein